MIYRYILNKPSGVRQYCLYQYTVSASESTAEDTDRADAEKVHHPVCSEHVTMCIRTGQMLLFESSSDRECCAV